MQHEQNYKSHKSHAIIHSRYTKHAVYISCKHNFVTVAMFQPMCVLSTESAVACWMLVAMLLVCIAVAQHVLADDLAPLFTT